MRAATAPTRSSRRDGTSLLGEVELAASSGKSAVLYGSGDRAAASPHDRRSGGHPDIDTLIHW